MFGAARLTHQEKLIKSADCNKSDRKSTTGEENLYKPA
jgi:hypothetical protein